MRVQARAQWRRAGLLLLGLMVLAAVMLFALQELRGALVFFRAPSDIAAARPPPGQRVRLGGMVRSWEREGVQHVFELTDFVHHVTVTYRGLVPDLFRIGQGAVVEGAFAADGRFVADLVMARHDETYMPPEAAAALARSARLLEERGASHLDAPPER